mmetsp:Transcript_23179/g.60621  ORF Transcript_23179/g.60621 Transcript_23179/m.60621 type:complete len:227 (+) Transcript_23179:517-1197(+)
MGDTTSSGTVGWPSRTVCRNPRAACPNERIPKHPWLCTLIPSFSVIMSMLRRSRIIRATARSSTACPAKPSEIRSTFASLAAVAGHVRDGECAEPEGNGSTSDTEPGATESIPTECVMDDPCTSHRGRASPLSPPPLVTVVALCTAISVTICGPMLESHSSQFKTSGDGSALILRVTVCSVPRSLPSLTRCSSASPHVLSVASFGRGSSAATRTVSASRWPLVTRS